MNAPASRPALDLRKLTVAALMTGVCAGEHWAWQLLRQLVANATLVSAQRWRRGMTPPPRPRSVPAMAAVRELGP